MLPLVLKEVTNWDVHFTCVLNTILCLLLSAGSHFNQNTSLKVFLQLRIHLTNISKKNKSNTSLNVVKLSKWLVYFVQQVK